MTKEKWENLSFSEKMPELIGSELWDTMIEDYMIEETGRGSYLEDYIQEYVNEMDWGWRDMMDVLIDVSNAIDNTYTGWVYRDMEYDGWDEFHELDNGELDELIRRYEETDEYEEFFTEEEPDFDGLEVLIA